MNDSPLIACGDVADGCSLRMLRIAERLLGICGFSILCPCILLCGSETR